LVRGVERSYRFSLRSHGMSGFDSILVLYASPAADWADERAGFSACTALKS